MSANNKKISALVIFILLGFALFKTSYLLNTLLEIKAAAAESTNSEILSTINSQILYATWYAKGLPNPEALTCASREYPRNTKLLVKNLSNGETVWIRVNDYGPEEWTGRQLDLSLGAAKKLDYVKQGVAKLIILDIIYPNT